ncbi:MAG: Vacuolar protease A [Geoglossum simile]|nr:MAG: Vacuolar protease A [Geoglossum simile]
MCAAVAVVRLLGLVALLGLVTGGSAGSVRVPLRASRGEGLVHQPGHPRRNGATQQPLGQQPDPLDGNGHPIKIIKGQLPVHTTNISIGTPPQPFSLALDLVEGTTFVPSSTCAYRCDEGYQRYNSSLSSTYKPNGSYMGVKWGAVNYAGFASQDTFHISDLSVPEFLFEEWTAATCYSIVCVMGGFDGVLGLAPPWRKGNYPDVPNALSLLLSNNLLSSPLFSLKVPRTEHDEGELLLGATNPSLYTPPLITLPIKNATGTAQSRFSDLWTVAATDITFDTALPLHRPLSTHYIALLDAANPWLILPSDFAGLLIEAIGAERGPYWYHNVPCSRRGELPALTFTLGGRNFSISAFDYIHEVDLKESGLICITTFWPASEFLVDDSDIIVLGSPFLKGMYGVFDMEKREIGLAPVKR